MKNVKYTNVPEIEDFFRMVVEHNDTTLEHPASHYNSDFSNTIEELKNAETYILNIYVDDDCDTSEDFKKAIQAIRGVASELNRMKDAITRYMTSLDTRSVKSI